MRDAKSEKILEKGVDEIIVKEHLGHLLSGNKKLRVKFGIDPTALNIHLGHSVPLRKLRQFQDAGHTIVLIIGDFTARIGDPSGRNEARKPLSEKEIKQNMKGYLKEAELIIDTKKAEVRYNSEWHEKEGIRHILSIAQSATLQQMVRREDFKKRIDEGSDISLIEILYPVLQGYDSVAVRANVEVGGTDQKFNLLMGRRIQRHFGMDEQDIITVPLLEGTDGAKKMSKSAGNYISLAESANNMFGKIMSIPDSLIKKYYKLLTDKKTDAKEDPFSSKMNLAEIITGMYHAKKEARAAREFFVRAFSKKEFPENAPILRVGKKTISIIDLAILGGIKSKSEARRLIEQGGVSINSEKVMDTEKKVILKGGETLKIGKKNFFRVSVS